MTGFADPITGGGILVQPAIQSPNFVTGVSGWIERVDGSAEFSNIVIRNGQLISGSSLFYSGTPAAGNLVASTAAVAGTDAFGNAYLAGETSYANVGGTFQACNSNGGVLNFLHAATEAGPWVFDGTIFAGGGLTVNTSWSVQGSLKVGPSPGSIREWYAPSGGDDFAALNTALSSYGSADLLPGTYELSAVLGVAGATLQGCDMATIVKPFGGYAGVLLAVGNKGVIRNLSVENSGGDAIQVPGGVSEWWLTDLYFSGNAGLCVNCTPTAATHGRIRGIRGAGGGGANGAGITVNGGTGAAVTTEINISDIDIQGCTAGPVLHLAAVTDVNLGAPFNGSVAAAGVAQAILVEGNCQNCDLGALDAGGGTTAVLVIQDDASGHSPTQIHAGPGVVQKGQEGVLITGGAARLDFERLWATKCVSNGWDLSNTGAFNTMSECGGNGNNTGGGVAYDVNDGSTGHWLNDGFRYVSTVGAGGVTAGRFLAAGNHYTEANPPSSLTTAGAAPGGW